MLLTLVIYLFFVVGLYLSNKKMLFSSFFKARKSHSWITGGLSIFMIQLSVDQGQLLTGIIEQNGMQGLWLLWTGIICAFVIPYVFAPYWKKLNFITDNQFILYRFPGKGGQFLYVFRALYVGLIVVSILLSFHLLAMTRVLEVFFEFDKGTCLLLCFFILLFFILLNRMDVKIKLDTFHSLIYLLVFGAVFMNIYHQYGGHQALMTYMDSTPDKRNLFPSSDDFGAGFSLFVFLGVQWWSVNMFDGGGPQMARFTAVASKKEAVLAGILPVFIAVLTSSALLYLVLLIYSQGATSNEAGFIEALVHTTPEYFQGMLFLSFLVVFVSSTESLINWGAGFLTKDFYENAIKKTQKTNDQFDLVSVFFMVLILIFASFFAFKFNSLQSIFKIVLSISAGVAPVYVLRWVWYRINAWSQISAMLSSLLFTSTYEFWYVLFKLDFLPFEESRVLFVTLATSLVWVSVSFLTQQDRKEVKLKMNTIIDSQKTFFLRLFAALFFGMVCLGAVVVFWLSLLR